MNGEEFIRVVPLCGTLESNNNKLKTKKQKQSNCLITFET